MMSDESDFPGEDAESAEAGNELDRHREELFERITQFMEDEDINEAAASFLLLDLALTLRMAAYGTGVKNPSAAGLKLDLDRLQREVADFIRLAKKGAEEFIRNTKEMLATIEEEEDEPEGE
jgi:hypothetical protein